MIAARRVDVADLNGLARTLMQETGRLTGECLNADGKEYQAGDRIVCLNNDRRLGVHNGTRGTVVAVEETSALRVVLDTGGQVTASSRYLAAGHVDHGYAITLHKAQGTTTEQAFVLGIRQWLSTEARYVAMS
jgi:ATP-dependent exoDNAse (exonuclease V) alpha subunit